MSDGKAIIDIIEQCILNVDNYFCPTTEGCSNCKYYIDDDCHIRSRKQAESVYDKFFKEVPNVATH